ncbi:ParA family protein [Streptomyces sp. MS19]|uniref:ParA family protein n=1 Tax=Streptomyces sp. MS19 TaxID=3385972 RepID=UPI0039A33EFF
MISIALCNGKAGVGTTTLLYHLAHMLSRQGAAVLAVDLDPQAELTALCLDEDEIEELWSGTAPWTVATGVRPPLDGTGDAAPVPPTLLRPGLWLLPGSLRLARAEERLSHQWSAAFNGDIAAVRTITAFHQLITRAAGSVGADVVLIDVGPHLGAIARAALVAADTVLTPLAADIFSLQGLDVLGPALRRWRHAWQRLVLPRMPPGTVVPEGNMTPLGYVLMRPEPRLDRPAERYAEWYARIPGAYASAVLGERPPAGSAGDDGHQIAALRNYRSLARLARDARKPMFDLRAADGALGSTERYVRTCHREFSALADAVLRRAEQAVGER